MRSRSNAADGFELVFGTDVLPVEIGAALRASRQAVGLSQGEVGERFGVASQNVARMELGGREPRLSSINSYVRSLNLELVLIARPRRPRRASEGDEP